MRASLRYVVVALVLAVLTPNQAVSQIRSWNNQCTAGAFQACASFSVELLGYDPTPSAGPVYMPWAGPTGIVQEGFTHLRFSVANRQGATGLPDPGAWGFRSATFTGLQTTYNGYPGSNPWVWYNTGPGGFLPVQSPGLQRQEGTQLLAAASVQGWEAITGANLATNGLYLGATGPHVLYGCAHPGTTSLWYYVGCDTSLTFDFYLPGQWSMGNNVQVAWAGTDSSGQIGCTVGQDCVSVPEPTSALLLLTGLMGLGFARRRRRDVTA